MMDQSATQQSQEILLGDWLAYNTSQPPQHSQLQMSVQFGIPISEITTDHPTFPWMVKHAGFIHNRFQLDQDGQTPYSRIRGQKYKSTFIACGEAVLCQHSHHENQKIPIKLEPLRLYGIWIGRDTSNGNHLTLTSEGRIKSRSVRRLTVFHRFNVAVLRSATGTPTHPSGRLQEFQVELLGLPQLMTRYHTRPRPESVLQRDDVVPTPGDCIQPKESTSSRTATATAASSSTSSDQPMERGQPWCHQVPPHSLHQGLQEYPFHQTHQSSGHLQHWRSQSSTSSRPRLHTMDQSQS
eukprot:4791715-Amphidinium_carterae.1